MTCKLLASDLVQAMYEPLKSWSRRSSITSGPDRNESTTSRETLGGPELFVPCVVSCWLCRSRRKELQSTPGTSGTHAFQWYWPLASCLDVLAPMLSSSMGGATNCSTARRTWIFPAAGLRVRHQSRGCHDFLPEARNLPLHLANIIVILCKAFTCKPQPHGGGRHFDALWLSRPHTTHRRRSNISPSCYSLNRSRTASMRAKPCHGSCLLLAHRGLGLIHVRDLGQHVRYGVLRTGLIR